MIRLELLLLIVTVSTLHIAHDQSTAMYNSSNYFSELNQRQGKFISDIQNIKNQIDQLNKDLNSSTISKDQQLTRLQQGMADQRDSLYNIETYLNTVSDIEPCRPCNLTQEQKAQMQNKIDSVRKSLDNLQSQVDFCPDCNQIKWIKQQINKQYNYLQFIQSTLSSGCLKAPYRFVQQKPLGLVNIANSLYKDNLKAPNWVYGSITQQQYKIYMFNRTSQYNLTSCPIQFPYVDYTQKTCMSCDGIFHLDTRKCEPCPEGQHFNLTQRKCVSNLIDCPGGTKLNNNTFTCDPIICLEGMKLDLNTNSCIQMCTPSQFYNVTTKKCQQKIITCPQGQFYNVSSKSCEGCPSGQFYNITAKVCQNLKPVCSQGQFYNQTSKRCQDLKCNPGYYFNLTTNKCEQIVCPSGQRFDFIQNKCIVKNTYSLCPPDKPYWNSTAFRCQQCPSHYPVFNTKLSRCQSCPIGQEWNQNSKTCQIQCPTGLILNRQTQKCECPQGKILNNVTNTCTIQCPSGQVLNINTNLCQIACPNGQKLNPNTNSCEIVCPDGQTLNPLTRVCQVQCSAGQYYNQTIKQCQMACRPNSQWVVSNQRCQCLPGFISNTTDCIRKTINCTMPTPYWNSVSKACQKCPADRPNFSPSINQCLQPCTLGSVWDNVNYKCVNIICPSDTPLLNFNTGKCQQCPIGTVWSSEKKICQSLNFTVKCPDGYAYNPSQKLCQMIVCPPGFHMNQVKKQCEKCPQGYAYNASIAKCYRCPDGSTYNASSQLCSLNVVCQYPQYFSLKQNKCKAIMNCLFNEYFSQQKQACIAYPVCKFDQVLNKNTKKCEPGPRCQSGYYYNQTIAKCEKINYVTSPNATNLIYGYNISQYAKQYQNKKKNDPYMRDCPVNTPYFDQNSKFCVMCPPSNPYFNLHTNLCQNCGTLGYDETLRRCKTNDVSVDPTLQRLIMNIL